jgi:hypothetical protein
MWSRESGILIVDEALSKILTFLQGGDGLVAARHLCKYAHYQVLSTIAYSATIAMFGYQPTIYLPKVKSLHIICLAIHLANNASAGKKRYLSGSVPFPHHQIKA